MDLVHLHLVLTHFPIAGVIFALILIVFSMVFKRPDFIVSAMLILTLSAILAIPLYLTGEVAEDAVENLAGVSKRFLELHEDAAEISFFLLEALGLLAIVGLVLNFSKSRLPQLFSKVLLVSTLIVTASIAWTSNLGGKIRHSEIRNDTTASGSVDTKASKRH